MPRIALDRSGNLRKGIFYRFIVPFEDKPAVETPTPEWIVVPRSPTQDELILSGKETYAWIQMTSGWERRVEKKDCAADREHVTHCYLKEMGGEKMGGKRLSPFVPSDAFVIVLSNELSARIKALNFRGSRIDRLELANQHAEEKTKGFSTLQFVGTARLRLPEFVDTQNRCPHCGKATIVCESCGYWNFRCPQCKQHMVVLESAHKGKNDRRVPYGDGVAYGAIEGRAWDGSDLVGGRGWDFASKRFIDWLLRIHAAPFYAEPVWFCVDGMNDQQKKWFDELQKPFEV